MLHQDVLSDALNSIRLRCFVPGVSELTAPWGVTYGVKPTPADVQRLESLGLPPPPEKRPKPSGSFFAIVRGSCWLQSSSLGVNVQLQGGDLVVLTRGGPVTLRDQPTSPDRNVMSLIGREQIEMRTGLRGGGGGAATTFVHGLYFFNDEQDNPLLTSLPPTIHVKGEQGRAVPWLEDTLRSLKQELMELRPGWQNVITHLSHVVFGQAVRAHFMTLPTDGPSGWFRALADPELASAIGAIHAQPADPWTVQTLAEVASMSRSAFAARFTAAIGESPLQYLTHARMRKARELLRDNRVGIKSIASAVGYANESAFSSAFKREVGVSPAAFRRDAGK